MASPKEGNPAGGRGKISRRAALLGFGAGSIAAALPYHFRTRSLEQERRGLEHKLGMTDESLHHVELCFLPEHTSIRDDLNFLSGVLSHAHGQYLGYSGIFFPKSESQSKLMDALFDKLSPDAKQKVFSIEAGKEDLDSLRDRDEKNGERKWLGIVLNHLVSRIQGSPEDDGKKLRLLLVVKGNETATQSPSDKKYIFGFFDSANKETRIEFHTIEHPEFKPSKRIKFFEQEQQDLPTA